MLQTMPAHLWLVVSLLRLRLYMYTKRHIRSPITTRLMASPTSDTASATVLDGVSDFNSLLVVSVSSIDCSLFATDEGGCWVGFDWSLVVTDVGCCVGLQFIHISSLCTSSLVSV